MNTHFIAFSLLGLFSQVVITVLVVAVYHFMVAGAKQETPQPLPPREADLKPKVEAPVAVAAVAAAPVIAPVVAQVAAPAAPTPAAPETVSPEIAAVIAAAVAVLLGESARVLNLQPVTPAAPHLNIWAWEGRMQIFMSHKVR